MKKGWKYLPFEKSIVKVKKTKSIKSKDYKEEGQYPVVSQESSLISGYFDDVSILYKHDTPVVIFGDHTQNVKYIDFDFIVGADGVHILSPIAEITPKFFYYQLKSIKLRNLGYARHYKLLKQESIGYPPLSEQERIVSLLDAQFAKIDAIKANAEKQLQDAKALFQSILCNLLSNDSWSYSTIGEVFKTYSGGTPHKSNKDYYENGSIPWINSGEVCQKYIETTNNFITEKGLKNSSAKYYPVNTVLVAMYGATAAQSGILKFEATSNQAVCGLLPNKNYVPEFVYYWFVYNKEKVASMAQGGAQPNLSQVKIKTINIPLISLEDQHQIAEQLDKISAKIHALQSNFDTTVTLCNDLKQSILKDIFG